ncbi:L,D-transpeptidase family protein [Kitasatospora sp. RG8]|uniref:L,D-transpeptidase family protein n=1 Tax=Kitasatospora sp. RG8 TaxID=2820815 RepID=UPI001AE00512|nr:L,D-transpeptidase family protein [Kitasatospora sp. RG8]MBP0455692.1 L,D-transpeptidase family protein [Kitasatospora sp. RG8]
MSGSHRATTYPPYEPVHDPAYQQGYEVPQQSYGVYEQPSYPDHGTPQPYGTDGIQPSYAYGDQESYAYGNQAYEQQVQHGQVYGERQAYGDGGAYDEGRVYEGYGTHGGYDAHDAYDQPFQSYPAEPVQEYYQEPAPVPAPAPAPDPGFAPGPVVAASTAAPAEPAPVGGRAAARRDRRKPKKKRTTGKAVTAGTALLLAAAAGWYTVGQDSAKPGLTTADGPGPEGVSSPDQPSPPAGAAAPAAAQAVGDRQTEAPAAARGEARPDGSVAAIPGLGAAFTARIPAETTQVVLASGQDKNANKNNVTLWTRTPEGRWLAGETWQGHNGNNGWTTDHNEGDLRSPIGVFSLTDAGGRKADPGGKLPYDKDPSFVVSGTGFFGDQLAGSFDYVIAINYNRVPGNSPLDTRRPMGSKKGGGIWIHVDHDGPTHGCVSIPEDKMAQLIRTLDPAAHPVIVMGDAASLAA